MGDSINSFEGLEAWKSARELVRAVYAVFKREPAARDFGLRDQVQRAAVSAMSNVAEGFERLHVGEKIQFYNISRASCGEVRSLSYILLDAGYVSIEEQSQIQDLAIRTGKLVTGLIRSTENRRT
jgi:four helix bundle protein